MRMVNEPGFNDLLTNQLMGEIQGAGLAAAYRRYSTFLFPFLPALFPFLPASSCNIPKCSGPWVFQTRLHQNYTIGLFRGLALILSRLRFFSRFSGL
jgi:hypothetical protein